MRRARLPRRPEVATHRIHIDHGEVFDNAPTGIALLTADGRFLAANRAFAGALGFEPHEIAGLTGINLVGAGDRELAAEWLCQLAEGNDTEISIGLHMRHRNGLSRWMLLDGRRFSRGGRPMLIVQARESSGLHDYISSLESLARSYELILHASGDGIVALDAKGNIVFANGAAATFLRRPTEELAGRPGLDVLPRPMTNVDRDAGLAEIKPAHGGRIVVGYRVSPVFDDAVAMGTIVMFSDIWRPVRHEARFHTAATMLDPLARLAAGITQGIDSPLTCMSSNITLLEYELSHIFHLLDTYAATESRMGSDVAGLAEIWLAKHEVDIGQVRDDIKSLLDEWRNTLKREVRIVRSLVDYACQDNRIEWSNADPNHLLDTTLAQIQCELRPETKVVREYGAVPALECYPARLNQVIACLLSNAEQSIPKERAGTITLRTGSDDGRVWIEIADDGIGIAPEHLPRIFDPFFTTRPASKGIGLGLPLTQAIVREHDGTMKVESEPGKGTRVRIDLPIRHDAPIPDRPLE